MACFAKICGLYTCCSPEASVKDSIILQSLYTSQCKLKRPLIMHKSESARFYLDLKKKRLISIQGELYCKNFIIDKKSDDKEVCIRGKTRSGNDWKMTIHKFDHRYIATVRFGTNYFNLEIENSENKNYDHTWL